MSHRSILNAASVGAQQTAWLFNFNGFDRIQTIVGYLHLKLKGLNYAVANTPRKAENHFDMTDCQV